MGLITAVESGYKDPVTFQEAYHHPNPSVRAKWREAIRKELRSMIRQGVYRCVRKRDVPPDKRLVGYKWVFKLKRDGTYKARLVAKGYTQIPGVNFFGQFCPHSK